MLHFLKKWAVGAEARNFRAYGVKTERTKIEKPCKTRSKHDSGFQKVQSEEG